ncbi:MAG TPA: hypothetical protein VI461_03970, partial [Chitinophagaceae bacterium]|nr:hypothetical protein [Chitinophagaceae bacterium]
MSAWKSFHEFFMNELDNVLRPMEEDRKKISRMAYSSFSCGGIAVILFLFASSGRAGVLAILAFFFFV